MNKSRWSWKSGKLCKHCWRRFRTPLREGERVVKVSHTRLMDGSLCLRLSRDEDQREEEGGAWGWGFLLPKKKETKRTFGWMNWSSTSWLTTRVYGPPSLINILFPPLWKSLQGPIWKTSGPADVIVRNTYSPYFSSLLWHAAHVHHCQSKKKHVCRLLSQVDGFKNAALGFFWIIILYFAGLVIKKNYKIYRSRNAKNFGLWSKLIKLNKCDLVCGIIKIVVHSMRIEWKSSFRVSYFTRVVN